MENGQHPQGCYCVKCTENIHGRQPYPQHQPPYYEQHRPHPPYYPPKQEVPGGGDLKGLVTAISIGVTLSIAIVTAWIDMRTTTSANTMLISQLQEKNRFQENHEDRVIQENKIIRKEHNMEHKQKEKEIEMKIDDLKLQMQSIEEAFMSYFANKRQK
jgi:uncharacterized protein HemX